MPATGIYIDGFTPAGAPDRDECAAGRKWYERRQRLESGDYTPVYIVSWSGFGYSVVDDATGREFGLYEARDAADAKIAELNRMEGSRNECGTKQEQPESRAEGTAEEGADQEGGAVAAG